MASRQWVSVGLLGMIALLLAALLLTRTAPAAQAQASEGRTEHVIAIAAPYGSSTNSDSLLYIIDTAREVILVYGFHNAAQSPNRDMRNGAFEFLAGRLYRWDLLLSTKREYAIHGVRTLQGLRVFGPGSSEQEYQNAEK